MHSLFSGCFAVPFLVLALDYCGCKQNISLNPEIVSLLVMDKARLIKSRSSQSLLQCDLLSLFFPFLKIVTSLNSHLPLFFFGRELMVCPISVLE